MQAAEDATQPTTLLELATYSVVITSLVQLIWNTCAAAKATGVLPPSALVALSPLWVYRAFYHPLGTWSLDLLLTVITHSIRIAWSSQQGFMAGFYTFYRPILLQSCLIAGVTISARTAKRGTASTWVSSANPKAQDRNDQSETGFPLHSQLIPARTTHTRFVPKKHSFSYSYFYVGVPVPCRHTAGAAVSADDSDGKAWFSVRGEDYLARSTGPATLYSKLRDYLRSQDIRDDAWDAAYLVTAPRFLGYSFNPVSFWYIYSKAPDWKLAMMVLEVNNTFDERRMYLLHPDKDSTSSDEKAIVKFRNAWEKDFHVSPFNSRKGSYSLVAKDILTYPVVDNTITLKSSKGETKLVARVFSDGSPHDATTLSRLTLAMFVLRWCWVGFITFPRILYEASRLYFKRGLHVWFRPEVMRTSIGRRTTEVEMRLERHFRRYIGYLVSRSQGPIKVTYIPPGDMGDPAVFIKSYAENDSDRMCELEIKVLSPIFYNRFVHYAHTLEAFSREAMCTDEKNRTVYISQPVVLEDLLSGDRSKSASASKDVLNWRWRLLKRLRCPPPAVSYPHEESEAEPGMVRQDIRSYGLSGLDRYVMAESSDEDVGDYQRAVILTFLADRYGFGFTGVIGAADVVVRLALVLTSYISVPMLTSGDGIRVDHWSDLVEIRVWMPILGSFALGSLVHIWALAKR